MSPQENDFSLLPNHSWWLNELFHRCQLDPNQTAVDFVEHAYHYSFESPEAVTLGLQIFAQRILLEVDHHRPVSTFPPTEPTTPITTGTATTPNEEEDFTRPTAPPPPIPSTQTVPEAFVATVVVPPNLPVSTSEKIPKHRNESTTVRSAITYGIVDEATRPSTLGTAEGLQLPVEKLCMETGQVLQRFKTGLDAQKAVSTCSQAHFFYYAVVGKNKVRTRLQ